MYNYLIETMETADVNVLNEKLKSGWKLLSVSSGRRENGEAYFLYSLGKFNEDEMLLDSL